MQIYKLEIKSVIPECELKIQALTMQDKSAFTEMKLSKHLADSNNPSWF